jgi:hypothetical protein
MTARAIRLPRPPKSLTVNTALVVIYATPVWLAAAVTPFTVRDIRRAEFARA